jgi:hypothetical protein
MCSSCNKRTRPAIAPTTLLLFFKFYDVGII